MELSPDVRDQVIRLLISGIGVIEASPGCQSCMVEVDALEHNRVHFSEKWASREAFEEHTHSEPFRRVLLAMDMCRVEPEVTVGNISGFSGITYLRSIYEREQRGAAGATHVMQGPHEQFPDSISLQPANNRKEIT